MKPAAARMALAVILHRSEPSLDTWLADHRRGLEPCPADEDWLAALQALGATADQESLRSAAVQQATERIARRHAIAKRHRQKRAAKQRAIWQTGYSRTGPSKGLL